MRKVFQTLFGGINSEPEKLGNCYPSCIASLLDINLEDVPHFFQIYGVNSEDTVVKILDWMRERNLTSVCHTWGIWIPQYMQGSLAIIGGKSPRGDWEHAVVGRITSEGWELVHDPHPSGEGIVGEPTTAEFIHKLKWLE